MGLENVAQDCGLDLEKPRAKLGGIMLYLFWGNVPPFFLFLQVVLFFSAKTWGGTQCLKFFPRSFGTVTQQQYVCVVVVYNIFLALCTPFGGSGAFQFPSDALFNHHSSTKLGGRGIKLIFATPPFLDMFFQLWLKVFSVGF